MMFRWTINSQEYITVRENNAVSIKTSMTQYHHWINRHCFPFSANYSSLWIEMSMVFLVTCIFSLFFEALNGESEVKGFTVGFIFTPYQRHWYACSDMQLRFFTVTTLLNNALSTCVWWTMIAMILIWCCSFCHGHKNTNWRYRKYSFPSQRASLSMKTVDNASFWTPYKYTRSRN